MRRLREERHIQQILPVAREFAAREHLRLERVRAATAAMT